MDRDQKRQALAQAMAGHLLQHGLGAATLRALASAAGTSDRMLLHYFADKQEILRATLDEVAAQFMAGLRTLTPGRLSQPDLTAFLARLVGQATFAPYTTIWLELAALAERVGEPYREIAARIGEGYLQWIKETLDAPAEAVEGQAAELLAFVEGVVVLHSVGMRRESGRAVLHHLRTRS